ncbi:MAG: TnsD family Tn7-like transposition protein [Clostridium sp.]|uniref:TnsD family Tn7-like transposition protein n=1 Tax=Clostridium sp. TaxID=1506 RepID=UPI003F377C78
MITYFPKVYDDELMYSIIGRYHKYSGNNKTSETTKELFNKKICASKDVQGYMRAFAKNVGNIMKKNEMELINNHTLIPVYGFFSSKEKARKILSVVLHKASLDVIRELGDNGSNITKKINIYYCPICSNDEFERNGEAYIHRTHQVRGVVVCEKHKCKLYEYSEELKKNTYIILKRENLVKNVEYYENEIYWNIARTVHQILNSWQYGQKEKIINEFKVKLKERNLIMDGHSERLRTKKLVEEFEKKYSNEILKELGCEVKQESNSWLKRILVKKRNQQYLRYILISEFLGERDKVLNTKRKESSNKKGICQNPFCENYNNINLEYENKRKNKKGDKYIVTYKCNCGYVYTRYLKGNIKSRLKVISYGEKWEDECLKLIKRKEKLANISKLMECDERAIIKFAQMKNCIELVNTDRRMDLTKKLGNNGICSEEIKMKHIEVIEDYIKNTPNCTQKKIRKIYSKEYYYLYKKFKEDLDDMIVRYNLE